MYEKCRFLLIGKLDNDPWQQIIRDASNSLGVLHIEREVDAFRRIQQHDYDVILIDAPKVEDTSLLTSSIRMQKPDARIVVATTSPTWEQAREAFRAGATNYIRRSMNKEEMLCELRTTMGKKPPPWRR